MSNIVKTTPPRKIPAEIAKLLGEPILWRGENREHYDAMLLSIGISVGANDIVDWLSVKDVGAVRNVVEIRCGAFSGNMKVSFQAARSIG